MVLAVRALVYGGAGTSMPVADLTQALVLEYLWSLRRDRPRDI